MEVVLFTKSNPGQKPRTSVYIYKCLGLIRTDWNGGGRGFELAPFLPPNDSKPLYRFLLNRKNEMSKLLCVVREVKEMIFTIERAFSQMVFFDGTLYLLDMRYTPDAGNECMAFRCDADGNVLSWDDVWVKHGMPLTQKEMNKCCSEFSHYMKRLKQHRLKERRKSK